MPSVSIVPTNNGGNGYTGLDFSQSGGTTFPPDSNGAAGPTSYVETVNQTVAIYSPKATGASEISDSLIHFFGTVGGLPTADANARYVDPVVVYDDNIPGATPTTGRFIVADCSQDPTAGTGASVFDIAVSKSANPTSFTTADWTFSQITTGEAGGLYADYPGNLAYNQDALVVTFGIFNGSVAQHAQVDAISITDLLNGVQAPRHTTTDMGGWGLRPAAEHDVGPGAPEWLVSTGSGSNINVYKGTNLLTSPSYAVTSLAVNPYSIVVPPLNPNGTVLTYDIESRVQKAAEAANTLVAATPISVSSTQDAVAWYVIDVSSGTPALKDQGTVSAGNNTYLTYPAIDINSSGQIGMTYMRSGTDSSTDYMSMWITGRTPSDPAGTMETPVLVPTGAGQANYSDSNSPHQVGDLSGLNVDPNDGSFWAVSEFANTEATANWGTAITNFTLAPPPGPADLSLTGSGPATGNEGDNLTYTFVVTNTGPSSAPGTILIDTLGANLHFVSATTSQGTFTQSGSTVTFSIGSMAVNGAVTATVTAQATEDGSLTSSASVTSSASDPNPGNNSAAATTALAEPAINVSSPITTSNSRPHNMLVATFTHANGVEPASAFSATINWGDGTTSAGTITLSGGTYTVTGSHRYRTTTRHTITTTVTEIGSSSNANAPAFALAAPAATSSRGTNVSPDILDWYFSLEEQNQELPAVTTGFRSRKGRPTAFGGWQWDDPSIF
jgi:uncharacterized repeat protein (TIGR01451 family)